MVIEVTYAEAALDLLEKRQQALQQKLQEVIQKELDAFYKENRIAPSSLYVQVVEQETLGAMYPSAKVMEVIAEFLIQG